MPARTARRLVLLGALTLAAAAAHSAPALAVSPCATSNDTCVVTPPTSGPRWVTVPGWENGFDGEATYLLGCPGNSRVGGADWTASANNELNVDLSLFQDGWPSPEGSFFATNSSTQPSTFAPYLGCVGASSSRVARGAAGGDAVTHRVKTLRVRPATDVTASAACREGERNLRGGAAVVFDSRPTRAELRDHDYRYRAGAHRVRVALTAGRTVGDDEIVTLQVHAVCREDATTTSAR